MSVAKGPTTRQSLANIGGILYRHYQPQKKVDKFVKYIKAEVLPPSPAEFGAVSKGINNIVSGFKTAKWKQLTVKEAGINLCVTMEVMFWFWFGEIIGRRHFFGYHVPADYCLEDDGKKS